MKLTSAFMLGCLFCCASTIIADGPGTRASNSYAPPVRVAQVPTPDPATSIQREGQDQIESLSPAIHGEGGLNCISAQVVFGPNRCPRPTMNQYTSPPFSYQIWAGYPAQRAHEEMLRDQTVFSPCPGGFSCRRPLSGVCASAHCVNGLSCGANGCATGACGIGGHGIGGYGMAGCATGACGHKGCGPKGLGLGYGGHGHGSLKGRIIGSGSADCESCDTSVQSEGSPVSEITARAQRQSPVLPTAALKTGIEVK